jgi:spore coat protein U-like protein
VNRVWILALAMLAGTVQAGSFCRVTTLTELSFGGYDPFSPLPTDSSATLRVTCDATGREEHVLLDVGLGPSRASGSINARRLVNASGPDSLQYGLFRESGRSSLWGMNTGIDTVMRRLSVPPHGAATVAFTIYGRIPPHQDVAVGTYSDTVQVTVSP